MKLLTLLAAAWAALITWLAIEHPYGARFSLGIWPVPQGTPWTYQLESGFVPALTVLTLLSAVFSLYHLKNCHRERCWRLGKHHINGLPWCNRHAVAVRPELSIEEILELILSVMTDIRDRQ